MLLTARIIRRSAIPSHLIFDLDPKFFLEFLIRLPWFRLIHFGLKIRFRNYISIVTEISRLFEIRVRITVLFTFQYWIGCFWILPPQQKLLEIEFCRIYISPIRKCLFKVFNQFREHNKCRSAGVFFIFSSKELFESFTSWAKKYSWRYG